MPKETKRDHLGKIDVQPGIVVKAARHKKGWTLADASSRTGISSSILSKIESGKVALSYDKISRISEALNIDIARLFSGAKNPVYDSRGAGSESGLRSVTRSGDGHYIETKQYGYTYHASDIQHRHFVPIVIDVLARSIDEVSELTSHAGQEYIFVLEGGVILYTDLYNPLELSQGDSVYYASGMAHAYVANAPGSCRILSICSGDSNRHS